MTRLTYSDWKMEVRMRKGLSTIIMSLALAASLVVAGCSGDPLSTREKGTLGGTAIGAGGGDGAAAFDGGRDGFDQQFLGAGSNQ